MKNTSCPINMIHVESACKYLKEKLSDRLPHTAFLQVISKGPNYIKIKIKRDLGAKESFSAEFIINTHPTDSMVEVLEKAESIILKFLSGRFYR